MGMFGRQVQLIDLYQLLGAKVADFGGNVV